MKQATWIAPLLALALIPAPATADEPAEHAEAQEQARIPFVDYGGIRNWRAADDDTIYVQDRGGDWYEATLAGPVIGLQGELAIGFETRGADTFDRFSSVVIDGWRYPVLSLVRLQGEPPRRGEA